MTRTAVGSIGKRACLGVNNSLSLQVVFGDEIQLRGQQMRYLIVGLCILGTACSGAASTSPTAPTAALSQVGLQAPETAARSGSDLPFNGDLQGTETVDGTLHHLVASGNGSQLGRFTYMAEITVDQATGNGTGRVVWTAANGDQLLTSMFGSIVDGSESGITIGETQTITGGTGRFAGTSGRISLTCTLEFATGSVSCSYTGAISLSH